MDRAKLIKAIECRKEARKRCGNPCEETGHCYYARCIIAPDGDRYLPYFCDVEQICEDALKLLKEQEVIPHQNYAGLNMWWCGCGWGIGARGTLNYCPNCGRKVKWDDVD